jgi:hypothetical protein
MRSSLRPLLSAWGEPRPLPGLAASAAQSIPWTLLLGLCLVYMAFGLFGHGPWRGDDLFGVALARQVLVAWFDGQGTGLIPNLAGSVVGRDGPLPGWWMASLIAPFEALSRWVFGHGISARWFDDLCRLASGLSLMIGLISLWKATDRLARRREAQPTDPLGIGPSAQSLGRTLGDCSVLIALACLGSITKWHEAGPAAVSFMVTALLCWALALAPEHPIRSGRLIGLLLAALTLTDGPEAGLAWALGLSMATRLAQPWRLASVRLVREALITLPLMLALFVLLAWLRAPALLSEWWAHQITWSTPEPLQALKTWAWTWWPMWPIIAVLWVQATKHRLWQLPHIQLVSVLVGVISLMALLGPGLFDTRQFLPVAPLAILAAFGLLSMPRSLTSLLDWFAVVVFTSLGSLIWLYWSAMSFGFPQNLASRLAVFAPGLKNPMPGPLEVFFGVAISGAWIILVLWRIRRGRPRLWRPVVLSAGGLVLAWILMMSLWMPALDINRGYNHLLPRLERAAMGVGGCIQTAADDRTSRALVMASQRLQLGSIGQDQQCGLLLVQVGPHLAAAPSGAKLIWTGQRAADRKDRERYLLYRLTDRK